MLVSEEFVIDLASLTLPCRLPFKRFDMRYEQDDENQRDFAYYNETGKILHHPMGRPAVCEYTQMIDLACFHLRLADLHVLNNFDLSGSVFWRRRHVAWLREVFQCEMGCRQ